MAATLFKLRTNSGETNEEISQPNINWTFSDVFLPCFILHAQKTSSLLTDNTLKNNIDFAIDYAAKIYLKDSNTNGISIGV
jgi:hypothetical protein